MGVVQRLGKVIESWKGWNVRRLKGWNAGRLECLGKVGRVVKVGRVGMLKGCNVWEKLEGS
jgi:hypothetical protein